MFSALKRDGVPLYKHARAGREVELEARGVEVYRLELLEFAPPIVTLEVECGRGFYVRSLAHDLGERLGCGAHLESLTRTGGRTVSTSKRRSTSRRCEKASTTAPGSDLLLPLDSVLLDWHAAILGEENAGDLRIRPRARSSAR